MSSPPPEVDPAPAPAPSAPPASERLVLAALAATLLCGVGRIWFDLIHWHDSQRVLECLLLAAAASAFVLDRAMRGRILLQASRLGWPAILLGLAALALGAVSAASSGLARFGLLEVALLPLLGLLSLSLMSVRARHGRSFDIAALTVAAIVCTILVTQFMGAYAAMLFSGTGIYPENLYRGGFSNPRFLGQVHTMLLPLLAAACLHPGLPLRWRAVVAAVLVLSLVMALLTASRATWYAWSAATVAVLVLSRPRAFAILPVQLAAVAAAGAAFYLMFVLPSAFIPGWDFDAARASFDRLGQPMTLSMRDVLWTRALELVAAHPLLGIGPMGGAMDMNRVAAHPHNALLQVASEWGLPAAALLCAAFAGIGWRLARGLAAASPAACPAAPASPATPLETDPHLRAGLAIALLGIAIHAAVDGVVVMPYTQMVLAAVAGWSAAVLLPDAIRRRPHPAGVPLAAALVGAALLALANGVLPEVFLLVEREEDFARAYSSFDASMPRFWAHGWLVGEVDPGAVRFVARPAQAPP